jgi:hypothetical protein
MNMKMNIMRKKEEEVYDEGERAENGNKCREYDEGKMKTVKKIMTKEKITKRKYSKTKITKAIKIMTKSNMIKMTAKMK